MNSPLEIELSNQILYLDHFFLYLCAKNILNLLQMLKNIAVRTKSLH